MSLLITIEGIDGSGKTTLIDNLKKKSNFYLITHNWRDTELGQKIWHLLNEARAGKKDNLPSTWTYVFLIFTAFDELVRKVIKPNLQENKSVVIDRYIDSTLVYQGLIGNIKIDTIQEFAERTINLPLPDVTFVLDIDPIVAQERLKKRQEETGEYTNWDNLDLDFHQKIRSHYLELKTYFPERIIIIDANKSEEEIVTEVWETIQQIHFPKKNLPQFSRAVIRNQKGKVLVVKDKKWGWNFPGGKIEENETPEEAVKREVFEETNLVIKDLKLMVVENIFFANLSKGNQLWKGYFFQTDQYLGEIKNKELDKIQEIKFVGYNSPEARETRQVYHKFFQKNSKNQLINISKMKLITVEGIDGCGKSTLAEKLHQNITNSLLTREPRGTELGRLVHDLTDKQINKDKPSIITNTWTYWFLYAAAQKEHINNVIKPAWEQGRVIISDRYVDSMFVYQGKLGVAKIGEILEKTIQTPLPDITFVLDIEVEKARERLNQRQDKNTNWDKMSLDFHQKIREGYLGLKEHFPDRIHIINADRSEEEIFKEVWNILEKKEKLY